MSDGAFKLTFVDSDALVAAALRDSFARFAEVTVLNDDLLSVAEDTIVSPANSYGFMDGGIDEAYSAAIPGVEACVQDAIVRRPEGHLPIGAAVIVAVAHARIKYVIAAPTMLMPEAVEANNAYRALRAALRVARAHRDRVQSVYCPGMCTGVGRVPPSDAAAAMAGAYADWKHAIEASDPSDARTTRRR
jgi:O-acetyl-ADP-ribose deacetylase (regulator of RNase III)